MIKKYILLSFLILAAFFKGIFCVENGANIYLCGYKTLSSGKLYAPGFNVRNSLYYSDIFFHKLIQASRTNINCSVDGFADILNLTYVPKFKILGARLGLTGIFPFVFQKIKYELSIPTGATIINGNRSGYGDTVFLSTLGWRYKENFHYSIATAIFFPTGVYDVKRVDNIGKNYYAIDPEFGLSWIFVKDWELSTLLGYTFNLKNRKTHYKSGDGLHLEYSLSKRLKNGLMVGLGGYWYQQVTGDSGKGASFGAFKGKLLSCGPVLSYTNTKRTFSVMAKYFHDLEEKNHFKGERFFLEGVFKF